MVQTTHAGAVAFQISDQNIYFLVVSSSNGQHWVLPKGHIENGERPDMAALRELYEEAGVIARIEAPLSTQHFTKADEAVVVQYYLVQALEMVTPPESRTLRWETVGEAVALLSFEESRRALEEGAAAIPSLKQ